MFTGCVCSHELRVDENLLYSKSCVKRPRNKWQLNEGQKYCRMLPLEHSAILLTCIKQYLVLKTNFGLFESGRFTQVVLYISSKNVFLACKPSKK